MAYNLVHVITIIILKSLIEKTGLILLILLNSLRGFLLCFFEICKEGFRDHYDEFNF